jgi:hypothetical protein
MDSYSAEVFAEARRQKILAEAEHRRLLRSAAAADPQPVRGRSWRARRPFAIVRRLTHVTGAS